MSNTRWQYLVVDTKGKTNWLGKPTDNLQETLNRCGAQGWELVSSVPVYGHVRFVFKRQG